MKENFKFRDITGLEINCYNWIPECEPKAIVQIVHGMAEHCVRYTEFAERLMKEGYIVYAYDHRGHGFTAENTDELGYMDDKDNFMAMVKNAKEITDFAKSNHKNVPVVLFGHSMGSFISQRYIELYGNEIDGVILSGTNGKQNSVVLNLGITVSGFETKVKGRKHKSKTMDKLSFGNFNNNFKPNRTNFDWLSRDEKEVDKYINDPYCGAIFTSSFFYDFLRGLKAIHQQENLNRIPKKLPIYIFAGDKDPVGDKGKGIVNLYNLYKDLNIEDVNYKLYKEGRHEMLNELNKAEVIEDVLEWINKHIR